MGHGTVEVVVVCTVSTISSVFIDVELVGGMIMTSRWGFIVVEVVDSSASQLGFVSISFSTAFSTIRVVCVVFGIFLIA